MNKTTIQKIRIDIISNEQSALSILMDHEGRISRQGSGTLPADEFEVMSNNDGSIFSALIDAIDEKVFEHAGIYNHPDKTGQPITYSIAFLGEEPDISVFEFRLGTETEDVGELMPYFDQFISKAVLATNQWYEAEKARAAEERVDES
ncbi:MAG TPA: hypothetical protein ENH92_03535 [Ectothiorhodospiraceae bacterium]|nr:hypothetical protein [Ectothiorhodospiraceae bacterium]